MCPTDRNPVCVEGEVWVLMTSDVEAQPNKPCPPQGALVLMFHHSNSNPKTGSEWETTKAH